MAAGVSVMSLAYHGGVKAGVLALQGDFREHARVFGDLGASPIEVRTPEDLAGLEGAPVVLEQGNQVVA